jgi:hypothetical protein
MNKRLYGLVVLSLTLGLTGQARSQYVFTPIDVPGAKETYALGFNDVGQVVGLYDYGGSTSHGFLLSDG